MTFASFIKEEFYVYLENNDRFTNNSNTDMYDSHFLLYVQTKE